MHKQANHRLQGLTGEGQQSWLIIVNIGYHAVTKPQNSLLIASFIEMME